MQFLHIVASHANTLRASSRVGEEGCDKALRTLYKREAIHHTVLPLGSIQLMFRKMPEPALTPTLAPPPPPSASDQGDSWNRAYSPQVS